MSTFSTTDLFTKLMTPWSAGPSVPIHYVTDGARWSFDWDAKYITGGLRDSLGIDSEITRKPWRLRGKVIHFGDRYCFFDGPSEQLARRNKLFLTWFHGERADPAMAPLFQQLVQRQHQVDQIVTTCRASREELLAAGICRDDITTIPLGVDLDRFRPCGVDRKLAVRRELGIPRDALCVGSFQKDGVGWGEGTEPKMVKGPDVFLESIQHLNRRLGKLFVLLTGPARGYVTSGLDKMGVPYLHRQLDEYWDLIPYYQALDLYMIASRCEGGPKALLESWAVGVPLVSTQMGMPADLVRDGVNGALADVEDASGLAEKAAELCLDPDYRHRCCQQALEDVRDYAWCNIARQYYEQLYKPHLTQMRAAS